MCLWVCYHDNSKIAYIDLHQTGLGKGSDHLQPTKFWPSCAPGKGSAAGRKFLALPYYSQRADCVCLSAFVIANCFYVNAGVTR